MWKIVVDGYKTPTTPPTDEAGKKNYHIIIGVMNVILGGLA